MAPAAHGQSFPHLKQHLNHIGRKCSNFRSKRQGKFSEVTFERQAHSVIQALLIAKANYFTCFLFLPFILFRVMLTRQAAKASMLSLLFIVACSSPQKAITLPGELVLETGQLVVHSDFYIPSKHRLIDELNARRRDISDQLLLPSSNEPINVFVFETENQYIEYMSREHPEFPKRRAFFVKNDTELKIFAWWGRRVGEDLRHEVTHGYLHSVVPNLPLWLDEGLAEYYETPRGTHGLNQSHVFLLNEAFRLNEWEPDLDSLEALSDPAEMTQLQYAECWLWIHMLLEGEPLQPKLLQDQLARLRMSAESENLSTFIDSRLENKDFLLIEHLKRLAEEL